MFYELLQTGQVYTISKATIKAANKQWSTVDNEYEMTLDSSTSIVHVSNSDDVPEVKYNTIEFSRYGDLATGTVVDVLAVVKEIVQFQDLLSKTQKQAS